MISTSRQSRSGSRALFALAAFLVLLAPACKLVSSTVNAPSKIASGLTGSGEKPPEPVPSSVLQAGVMRFADTYASRIQQATEQFAEKAATPEARVLGMTWAIRQCTSAFTIATGANARVNLLDMIVLVTLGRMTHEEYLLPKVWGEADRPMLVAFQEMEKDIWDVAIQTLSQAQQDEMRAMLREWRDKNPDMAVTAFVRLPAFEDLVKARKDAATKSGNSLGDLLSVDPMSGLEPAVRELEQARMFAERTVFYLQRAPILLSAQVELLTLKMAQLPETHSVLEDSRRVSLAAASVADTAAKLPDAVRVEREAAVKQISDELTLQRQGLVADLEKAQAPTSKILTDAQATLEAGTQLSAALQGTIGTVDKFLDRFEAQEPAPGAPPPPPAEPGRPFDITEYGDTATRVGETLKELNAVMTSLDHSLPQVQRVVDEAASRGERTIDHAFARGVQLGAALIGLAAIAALGVRWLSARFISPKPRSAAS